MVGDAAAVGSIDYAADTRSPKKKKKKRTKSSKEAKVCFEGNEELDPEVNREEVGRSTGKMGEVFKVRYRT